MGWSLALKRRAAKHEPPYLWMGPRFGVWLEMTSDDSHEALDVIVAQLIERFTAKVVEEYPPGVHDGDKEYIALAIDGQQFMLMRLPCIGTGLSGQNTDALISIASELGITKRVGWRWWLWDFTHSLRALLYRWK